MDLELRIENLENTVDDYSEQLDGANHTIETLRSNLEESQQEVVRLETLRVFHESQANELEETISDLEWERDSAQGSQQDAEDALEEIVREMQSLREDYNALHIRVHDLTDATDAYEVDVNRLVSLLDKSTPLIQALVERVKELEGVTEN